LEDSSRSFLVLECFNDGSALSLKGNLAYKGLIFIVVSHAENTYRLIGISRPDNFNHAIFITGLRSSNNNRSNFTNGSLRLDFFLRFFFCLGLFLELRVTSFVTFISFFFLVSRFNNNFYYFFNDRL
jgi:hypothetical protein